MHTAFLLALTNMRTYKKQAFTYTFVTYETEVTTTLGDM